MNTEKIGSGCGYGLGLFIILIIGAMAFGLYILLVQILWNAVIPSMTGWYSLSYWDALWLCVLFYVVCIPNKLSMQNL